MPRRAMPAQEGQQDDGFVPCLIAHAIGFEPLDGACFSIVQIASRSRGSRIARQGAVVEQRLHGHVDLTVFVINDPGVFTMNDDLMSHSELLCHDCGDPMRTGMISELCSGGCSDKPWWTEVDRGISVKFSMAAGGGTLGTRGSQIHGLSVTLRFPVRGQIARFQPFIKAGGRIIGIFVLAGVAPQLVPQMQPQRCLLEFPVPFWR